MGAAAAGLSGCPGPTPQTGEGLGRRGEGEPARGLTPLLATPQAAAAGAEGPTRSAEGGSRAHRPLGG